MPLRLLWSLTLGILLGFGWLVRPANAETPFVSAWSDLYETATINALMPTMPRNDYIRYYWNTTLGSQARFEWDSYSHLKYVYTSGSGPYEGSHDYWSEGSTNSVTWLWAGADWANTGSNNIAGRREDCDWVAGTPYLVTNLTVNVYDTNTVYGYGPWATAAFPYPGADYLTVTHDYEGCYATVRIHKVTTLQFITESPSNSTGSALFKLTSGFGIPGATNENVLADFAGAYTLAGETPDSNGVVWKTYADGSTNDVSVRIRSTHTNAVTNFTFNPTANRATLGIQWKSADTNQTNWDSGPLYVLKGTTVLFRVQATVGGNVDTNVNWPTGTPAWSASTNNSAQISVTFTNVSSDTNGQWITVTAGTMASNRVVVFDYEVKFQPSEGPGRFEGRAEYPTGFGVGESVDFVAKFDPEGITTANAGGIEWTVTGMYYESSYLHDLSETNATGIKLGAFEETDSVVGMVASGASAGASRSNAFSVWRPKAVILRDMIVTNPPSSSALIDWPHVWHNSNSVHCIKRAAYFLEPRTNCYSNLKVREGSGDYTFSNGTNVITDVTNLTAQITFTLTNSAGVVTFGPHTVTYDSKASHPTGTWCDVFHLPWLPGGTIQPNFWGIDRFGGRRPTLDGVVPNPADHVPVILTTQSVPIRIKFKLRSVDDFYFIENVTSRREFYSTGRMTIEKKGSGVGSGPHTKEFTDADSDL